MTTSYNQGTMTTGMTWSPSGSPEPAKVPKGMIVTRAVETKVGWVGQIVVAEEIIWESDPRGKAHHAEEDATFHVVGAFRAMLLAHIAGAVDEIVEDEQPGADATIKEIPEAVVQESPSDFDL